MNNKNFTNLNESELYDTQGGIGVLEIIFGIATVVGTCYAAYATAKDDAYNAGVMQAYQDMKK
ncbi:MAG: hypothetical protein J6K17_07375 [Oscillospiraceae bacterium]|nr:hypothetical protein [Oscillospiraceae bacterium]